MLVGEDRERVHRFGMLAWDGCLCLHVVRRCNQSPSRLRLISPPSLHHQAFVAMWQIGNATVGDTKQQIDDALTCGSSRQIGDIQAGARC